MTVKAFDKQEQRAIRTLRAFLIVNSDPMNTFHGIMTDAQRSDLEALTELLEQAQGVELKPMEERAL